MGAACSAPCVFPLLWQLPREVQAHIWELIPVDERVCLASTSRAWRAALAPPALWEVLDLSVASGVRVPVTDAVLRTASARARGTLRVLNLDGATAVSLRAVFDVACANGATLCEVRLAQRPAMDFDDLRALLHAAPALRALVARANLSYHEMVPALRGAPPFAPFVAADALHLSGRDNQGGLGVSQALRALAPAGRAQHLRSMSLHWVELSAAGALDALVDASLTCAVVSLSFMLCSLPHESTAPALVRLLSDVERGPTDVSVFDLTAVEWREPDVAQLAVALHTNTRLTRLFLYSLGILRRAAVFDALLRALVGHASLQELRLNDKVVPADRVAADRAIAALLAADSPALTSLDISCCDMGPEALVAIAAALSANTHLQKLNARGNGANLVAAEALTAAVRANTSLRFLQLTYTDEEAVEGEMEDFGAEDEAVPALRELEALVEARNNADPEGVQAVQ